MAWVASFLVSWYRLWTIAKSFFSDAYQSPHECQFRTFSYIKLEITSYRVLITVVFMRCVYICLPMIYFILSILLASKKKSIFIKPHQLCPRWPITIPGGQCMSQQGYGVKSRNWNRNLLESTVLAGVGVGAAVDKSLPTPTPVRSLGLCFIKRQ